MARRFDALASVCLGLFALACLGLFCLKPPLAGGGWTAAGGMAMGLWCSAVVLLGRRLRQLPAFSWVLLGAGFAISWAAALLLHPPLESDFLLLYEAARAWLRGDTGFQQTVYFQLWAYQSAYVAWEAALLSVWADPKMIQLVHCLLFSGTILLLYRLLRGQISETAARVTAVLMLSFPTCFTLPSVLTNQIPSAFFLCLGLWVLLSGDTRFLSLGRFPLAGLSLQLGHLLRPEGALILAALGAAALLRLLERPRGWWQLLLGGVLLAAAYGLSGHLVDLLTVVSGLNDQGLSNGNPLWKFVLGFNHETGGTYAAADWARIYPTLDAGGQVTEATLSLERAMIAERLRQPPGTLLRLFLRKIWNLWVADSLSWAMAALSVTDRWGLRALIRGADRTLFCLLLLVTAAAAPVKGARPWDARGYVPHLVVLASVCAFLIVEVQPRYAYLPLLFFFGSAGHALSRAGATWLRWEVIPWH